MHYNSACKLHELVCALTEEKKRTQRKRSERANVREELKGFPYGNVFQVLIREETIRLEKVIRVIPRSYRI